MNLVTVEQCEYGNCFSPQFCAGFLSIAFEHDPQKMLKDTAGHKQFVAGAALNVTDVRSLLGNRMVIHAF
jgi:hypothetical protein